MYRNSAKHCPLKPIPPIANEMYESKIAKIFIKSKIDVSKSFLKNVKVLEQRIARKRLAINRPLQRACKPGIHGLRRTTRNHTVRRRFEVKVIPIRKFNVDIKPRWIPRTC